MRNETSLTMTLYPLRLSPLSPPEGITLRHFQDGDEAIWESMATEGFQKPISFESHMRKKGFMPEHTWFASLRGQPSATASAWFRPELGQRCGYIHMVCAYSAVAGQRLGYWATLAALHQLKCENCVMAILHTDDFRLSAIWTYLNLGFRIAYDTPDAARHWEAVLNRLNLKGDIRELLSAPSRFPKNFMLFGDWPAR